MVRFEKDKIIIEIETICPVEIWTRMQDDLISLYSMKSQDKPNTYYHVLELLSEMCLSKNIVEVLENQNKKGGL